MFHENNYDGIKESESEKGRAWQRETVLQCSRSRTWPKAEAEEKEPNMRDISKLELQVLMMVITDERGQLEGKEESYKVPSLKTKWMIITALRFVSRILSIQQ